MQSNDFNASKINTVLVAVITGNTRLAEAPGNVKLGRKQSKLRKPSVVNVSQLLTVDKGRLDERVSQLPHRVMFQVDAGLRLTLGL